MKKFAVLMMAGLGFAGAMGSAGAMAQNEQNSSAQSQEQQVQAPIEELVVRGRKTNLVGEASSASEGYVSQEEIALRPLLRTGEVLETVPGLVATQHSGPGKANQYFLRGFNLDHGTDFATVVDSMPVNMRTHGHGQGYTDLNFIIPELVGEIVYRKGTYYSDIGDFSGTGTARLGVIDNLSGHTLRLGSDLGEENWNRFLATGDIDTGDLASLLYGVEYEISDGHWADVTTDLDRKNFWLKQRWQDGNNRYHVAFMGYDNSWNSADQIPQRAVDSGLITEFGSLNTTSGGESSRYSLSGNWTQQTSDYFLTASAYAIDYKMSLFADFTYFLDNPVDGDQHNQFDDRTIYGWDVALTNFGEVAGFTTHNTFGTQLRFDDIKTVGLYRTAAKQRVSTVREDAVDEWSLGVYWANELHWTDAFRTVVGLRYDHYDFSVNPLNAEVPSTVAVNGGSADDGIATPSLGFIYAFNDTWEAYASVGKGFHSNDARGVLIQQDPTSGDPLDQADPLVETFGYEFGLRAFYDGVLNTSIALWSLDIDSELIFVGDSGGTEDTGVGSERQGLEITAYYYPNSIFTFDVEYSYSDAQYKDGSDIAGALEHVFSGGVNARFTDAFYANFRIRYFGEYPLDGGQIAESSSIANLRLSYDIMENLTASVDVLNLFDSDDRDIQYVYESQLASEGAPVEDRHFHIYEPRTYHFNLAYRF